MVHVGNFFSVAMNSYFKSRAKTALRKTENEQPLKMKFLLRVVKKQDGNFGYEKSFLSFAPCPDNYGCDYGKRKNTSESSRIIYALRRSFCFDGRYSRTIGHEQKNAIPVLYRQG